MLEEINQKLSSFVSDPADSDFQRGYLAALLEIDRGGKHPDEVALWEQVRPQEARVH